MSIIRLLPAWLHAVADYAVGITLVVVSLAVGGADKAVATGVVVGAVVLAVSMLTRYPLGVLNLTVRATNCLQDVSSIDSLLAQQEIDLIHKRNFGRTSLLDCDSNGYRRVVGFSPSDRSSS